MTPANYWKQVREVVDAFNRCEPGTLRPMMDAARLALPLALARIEELEAALECERPRKEHNDLCALGFDEGQCDCAFGVINRRINTALGKP